MGFSLSFVRPSTLVVVASTQAIALCACTAESAPEEPGVQQHKLEHCHNSGTHTSYCNGQASSCQDYICYEYHDGPAHRMGYQCYNGDGATWQVGDRPRAENRWGPCNGGSTRLGGGGGTGEPEWSCSNDPYSTTYCS